MKGFTIISKITQINVRIHDGVDWCDVDIDLNELKEGELKLNIFEQLVRK